MLGNYLQQTTFSDAFFFLGALRANIGIYIKLLGHCTFIVMCKKVTKNLGGRGGSNIVDQEQRSSLICVHTVCHRGFLNISADMKSRQLVLRLAH